MGDSLSTIWPAEKHTLAKHNILKTYLKAWAPIMSRQSRRMGADRPPLFVDGFAGPGVYEKGQDGSPILALKAVLTHSVKLALPVRFMFIEKDPKRYQNLKELIDSLEDEIKNSQQIHSVEVELDDCEQVIRSLLDNCNRKGETLGPALLFLDQFGYSDVSMALIKKVMNERMCEVFSYLNWGNMNRFMIDEEKWATISNAFGSDEWKEVLNLEQKDRAKFMLRIYRNALRAKAGSKYVWYFDMCDSNEKLIYWLFFCTNNLRGLEEMKKAMWKVDQTGGFRFSDKDNPSQLYFFKDYKQETLAKELSSKFRGQTLRVGDVKEFVLTETPAYVYKTALKLLEKEGSLETINEPAGRRKWTFADDQMQVKFLPNSC